jgi:hypothetical protein
LQSHFSILSVSIRPDIQEQIAVGLLLVGNDSVHFHFSKNKMAVIRELIPQTAWKFVKDTLRQISETTINQNEDLKGIYAGKQSPDKVFSLSYLEYLGKYNNNLVAFTSPKVIELDADEKLFQILFKKYIDEYAFIEKVTEPRAFDNLKREFFSKVQNHFNVEQEVSNKEIPGLIIPVKVDLIGKNNRPVFAHAIDLEHNNYHIQNDLAILFMLTKVLNDGIGFHISAEPDQIEFPQQHDTWKILREFKETKYVDLSEAEIIKDYAIKHDVEPFIKIQ